MTETLPCPRFNSSFQALTHRFTISETISQVESTFRNAEAKAHLFFFFTFLIYQTEDQTMTTVKATKLS